MSLKKLKQRSEAAKQKVAGQKMNNVEPTRIANTVATVEPAKMVLQKTTTPTKNYLDRQEVSDSDEPVITYRRAIRKSW